MFDDLYDVLSNALSGEDRTYDGIVEALANDSWNSGLDSMGGWFTGSPDAPMAPEMAYLPENNYGRDTLSAMGLGNDTAPSTLTSKPQQLWNDTSGWLGRLAEGDKKTLGQARFGLGALGLLGSLFQSRKSRNQLSPAQLQAMLKSPYSTWTPQQQASFNNYFYRPLQPLSSTYQPVKLADGGRPVPGTRAPQRIGEGGGALSRAAVAAALAASAPRPQSDPSRNMRMLPRERERQLQAAERYAHGGSTGCACGGLAMASGGPTNYVQGPTMGQEDQVDARLSHGEYVFDADVVSALGDGNNEAGAQRLDDMREAIRKHKRGAPASKIPPKAKSPLAYLKEQSRGRS